MKADGGTTTAKQHKEKHIRDQGFTSLDSQTPANLSPFVMWEYTAVQMNMKTVAPFITPPLTWVKETIFRV